MPLAIVFRPGWILSVLAFGLLLGWIVWRWSRRSEDAPGPLMLKIVASLGLGALAVLVGARFHPIVGIPLAAGIAIIVGALWGRNIGAAIAKPLTSLYDGGDEAPEPQPFYAIADAHRIQARYASAIEEIEKQLERFPGDVEGLLKLAEIRARHLDDWAGAEAAIDQVAGNTAVPATTRAKALQALADWHLDFKRDNEGAIECLRRIETMLPGTPEAHEAAQRLAHVGDGNWRREKRAPGLLRVTNGDQRLGLRAGGKPGGDESPAAKDPEDEVRELLEQLRDHPVDTEARERLALVYADQLGHLDWAVAEIGKLVALPSTAGRQVARWLHLLADLHIRCGGDEAAARGALGRIIELYPETALAAKAQSRLDLLELEMKGRRKTDRIGSRRPDEDLDGRPGGASAAT